MALRQTTLCILVGVAGLFIGSSTTRFWTWTSQNPRIISEETPQRCPAIPVKIMESDGPGIPKALKNLQITAYPIAISQSSSVIFLRFSAHLEGGTAAIPEGLAKFEGVVTIRDRRTGSLVARIPVVLNLHDVWLDDYAQASVC